MVVVVIADKAHDSEDNHVLVREKLDGYSIIPSRYENVPIWKTKDRYNRMLITKTKPTIKVNGLFYF